MSKIRAATEREREIAKSMLTRKQLVDRDKVLKILAELKSENGRPSWEGFMSLDEFMEILNDKILDLPFYPHVYEERKNGEWHGPVCSACGANTKFWRGYSYCPYCGAKMEDYDDG